MSPDKANTAAEALRWALGQEAVREVTIVAAILVVERLNAGVGWDEVMRDLAAMAVEEGGLDEATLNLPESALNVCSHFVQALAMDMKGRAGDLKSELGARIRELQMDCLLRRGHTVYDPQLVRHGCLRISRPRVQGILSDLMIVARPDVDDAVQNFLTSNDRLHILVGGPRMGKSTSAATIATESSNHGWAVLLTPAPDFDIVTLAEQVVYDGLRQTDNPNWRLLFIRSWTSSSADEMPPGLLFVIDGAERAPEHVIRKVSELLQAGAAVPARTLKVLITCSEETSQRVSRSLTALSGESQVSHLAPFTDTELDSGLSAIGADKYLLQPSPGEWPDPYIASAREMLKQPAAFAYMAKHSLGGTFDATELSVIRLVCRRAVEVLEHVQDASGAMPASVRDCFSDYFAIHRPGQHIEIPLENMPILLKAAEKTASAQRPSTVLRALLQGGVLAEDEAEGRAVVHLADMEFVTYCYSYSLQRQATDIQPEALPDWAAQRLLEIYEVPATSKAMLIWLDRIFDGPDMEQRVAVVNAGEEVGQKPG